MNTIPFRTRYIADNTFTKDIPMTATRDGYGAGLIELGKINDDVVALTSDVSESTRVSKFAEIYPERFIEMGVAEQNMAVVATGLALEGKIPFMTAYSVFSPGRNWDQIRISICYQNTNVKIGGSHGGISVGADGATHQGLEDIALMRVLPNMKVLVPCDAEETRKAVHEAARIDGPVYIRFARNNTPHFTTKDTPFTCGRGIQLTEGSDVSIIACGPVVFHALCAASDLAKKNIGARVINMPSIKPIDHQLINKCARETGAIITVEEHQIYGGLGSAVAEVLVQSKTRVPQEFIGMPDCFGETGEANELLKKYNLDAHAIVRVTKKILKRKE